MMIQDHFKRGYLFVISAAVFWAISGTASKYLFNSGITAFQLVQLRITFAALFLCIWLLVYRPSLIKIERGDILYFVILGWFGMASAQVTYLFAISKIKVAAAILLQYLAPSLIALYSVIVLRERLKPITILALIIAMSGCYLVVGAYSLDILSMNKLGIISGILSAITFAFYSVRGEYGMRKYNPWTVLFYALLFGTIPFNIIFSPAETFIHAYRLKEWFWIFYIASVGTIVPFGLYFEGINLLRSTRASITATLEPITAGLISFIFLGEIMEPLQMLGGILVIVSIVLLQLRQEHDDNAPNLIRAQRINAKS